jgi:hypothetical protein
MHDLEMAMYRSLLQTIERLIKAIDKLPQPISKE